MNTLKRDHQKSFSPNGFLLFQDIQSICSKSNEKGEIKCELVTFDNAYEKNDDTDFKIETVDNFHLSFNEFYDISRGFFFRCA